MGEVSCDKSHATPPSAPLELSSWSLPSTDLAPSRRRRSRRPHPGPQTHPFPQKSGHPPHLSISAPVPGYAPGLIVTACLQHPKPCPSIASRDSNLTRQATIQPHPPRHHPSAAPHLRTTPVRHVARPRKAPRLRAWPRPVTSPVSPRNPHSRVLTSLIALVRRIPPQCRQRCHSHGLRAPDPGVRLLPRKC